MSVLTNSQIDFFNQNGYLVIEDYYAPEAVQEMKKQVEVLLDSFNLESEETFTTGPDQVCILYPIFTFLKTWGPYTS